MFDYKVLIDVHGVHGCGYEHYKVFSRTRGLCYHSFLILVCSQAALISSKLNIVC